MLINYRCKNFGPFNDTIDFSMKPGKVTSRFKDNVNEINDKLKVSKIAVIVGENAGGKTSFMRSLDFFKFILLENRNMPYALKILCNKYNNDLNQEFEICIMVDKNIYTYKLELDDKSVTKEALYVRKNNQGSDSNKVIFEYKRIKYKKVDNKIQLSVDIDLNSKYVDDKLVSIIESVYSEETGERELFIKYLKAVGVEIVNPFIEFIDKNISINLPEETGYNLYRLYQENEEDKEILKDDSFKEIFSLIDSSIIGIDLDEEEPYTKTKIIRSTSNGEIFEIEIIRDSSGVREFFAWAVQIWKVIHRNSIVFADEIDRVLNSILAVKIINYIKGKEHKGQFIFSTHNVLHLNTSIFMKEQIYFVSKNPDTLNSEMYSLADFKDYKYDNPNVYEIYLKGLLGGVPND